MRRLLLGGAAALAFAGLANAQTVTLTGDETITISGEAIIGQIWAEDDLSGVVTYRRANRGVIDLDMLIEGDGWTLVGDNLDNNFLGEISLETDSGLFITNGVSNYIDTSPEDYLMYGGFIETLNGGLSAPRWSTLGGGGNHSLVGQGASLYYQGFAGGIIGYQSNGLTLAMASAAEDEGWSANLAGSLEAGAATVAAMISDTAMSAMLTVDTREDDDSDGLLLELAYWSFDDPTLSSFTKGERTALTLSYTVAGQTLSMAYHPEHDYTLTAFGDQTGSEVTTVKYEGDFDGFGLELGFMDRPKSDLNTANVYARGGSSSSVVLTFDLAENVEFGIGYVQSSEVETGASPDAETQRDRSLLDIGVTVEF